MQLREAIKSKLAQNFKAFKTNQDPGEDEFFILNARKRRRLTEAARKRDQKKGRRAWIRRQIAQQQVTSDLAHQLAILDRVEPASPSAFDRVATSLSAKTTAVMESQSCSAEEAHQHLRALAGTAPEPSRPKLSDPIYAQGGLVWPNGRPDNYRALLSDPVYYGGRGA